MLHDLSFFYSLDRHQLVERGRKYKAKNKHLTFAFCATSRRLSHKLQFNGRAPIRTQWFRSWRALPSFLARWLLIHMAIFRWKQLSSDFTCCGPLIFPLHHIVKQILFYFSRERETYGNFHFLEVWCARLQSGVISEAWIVFNDEIGRREPERDSQQDSLVPSRWVNVIFSLGKEMGLPCFMNYHF